MGAPILGPTLTCALDLRFLSGPWSVCQHVRTESWSPADGGGSLGTTQRGVWRSAEKCDQRGWAAGSERRAACGATALRQGVRQGASRGPRPPRTPVPGVSHPSSRRGHASRRKSVPRPRAHLREREREIARVSSTVTGCMLLPEVLCSVFLRAISLKPYSTDFSVLEKTDSSQTVSDGLLSLKSNNIFNLSLFLIFPPLYAYLCVLSWMNEWWIHTLYNQLEHHDIVDISIVFQKSRIFNNPSFKFQLCQFQVSDWGQAIYLSEYLCLYNGYGSIYLVRILSQLDNTWASQVALVVKNLPANAGDRRPTGSIPGSGRSPGGGNGNPLQHSCLENPMDKGDWEATVHSVAKSQTGFKQRTCALDDK